MLLVFLYLMICFHERHLHLLAGRIVVSIRDTVRFGSFERLYLMDELFILL